MKISGFTFCRNAVKYDYPIVESIKSILPIVDEYVVNVGKSEDNTLKLIESIGDPRIRVVESVWDESIRKGGLIFSQQTNIALQHCVGDWAIYLQADEVIHENDLPGLIRKMKEALPASNILGLSFRYLHFYGDYYTINPWFYRRAVRIIRNNGDIESFGDAVGFCNKKTNEFIRPKDSHRCVSSGARIFHYGYVKDSKVLIEKVRYQASRHHGDTIPEDRARKLEKERYEFDEYDILKNFRGAHPRVMDQRVRDARPLKPGRNRWLNPAFYKYVLQHGFKG
jgi:hypothetical protein